MSKETETSYKRGVAVERLRIIDLINACPRVDGEKWHVENVMCCEGRCDFDLAEYQDRLIALIKGEN
jgi:hypothetical protein